VFKIKHTFRVRFPGPECGLLQPLGAPGIEAEIPQPAAGGRGIGAESPVRPRYAAGGARKKTALPPVKTGLTDTRNKVMFLYIETITLP
jgi:hypothetical protein